MYDKNRQYSKYKPHKANASAVEETKYPKFLTRLTKTNRNSCN